MSRTPRDLDGILSALSDPTRRRVIDLLRRRPRRAAELARALDKSPPTMSKHLRVLRRHGLVEDERLEEDARVRMFRLRPEPFAALQGWLEDVRRYWSDQLEAFRAHAEGARKPRRRRR